MLNKLKLFNYIQSSKYNFLEFAVKPLNFFYIRMYLIIITGIIFLNWLFVYVINLNISKDLVVLHYNVDFGVNLIGSVKQIYIVPLLGAVIFLANLILLVAVLRQNQNIKTGKFIAHVLLGVSLLANTILSISLVLIYLFNFYI